MNQIGYIKLHRALFSKPIWINSTAEQKVILMTLLAMANFKDAEWIHQKEVYKVKAGQFLTSIPSIMAECGKGISEQNVRTALKRFEKLGFLTDQQMTRNKNRIITITNWSIYQGKTGENLTDSLTDDLTDNLTDIKTAETLDTKGFVSSYSENLTDTLTDTLTDELNPREEVKKLKNNNTFIQQAEQQFNDWWNLFGKKVGKAQSEKKFKQLLKRYKYSIIEDGTKRYLLHLEQNNIAKQYQKNPLTFLNGEHFNDEYESNSSHGQSAATASAVQPIQLNLSED